MASFRPVFARASLMRSAYLRSSRNLRGSADTSGSAMSYQVSLSKTDFSHGGYGFGGRAVFGVKAALQGIDQRGADHGATGIFGDRARRFRGANAKADADRQFGVPLDAGDGLADDGGIGAGAARDTSDR